jgi:DNA-binding XRE family transcriptional regulator
MTTPGYPFSPVPKLIQDTDTCKALGCYVRAGRNALGLSQADLADLLGVNRTTLLRLEKGIAPLRSALCLSAVEVLRRLGATSEQIELLVAGKGRVTETINFSIDFLAMKQTQEIAETRAASQGGIVSLLGTEYIPPLVIAPLRKK